MYGTMNNKLITLAVFLLSCGTIFADVYMHNPRGSNDRNCERNVNRNNGNRLFDSQNNNKGGYACPRGVGDEEFQAEDGSVTFNTVSIEGGTTQFTQQKRMYYYSGSILPIEWTNQHGCGGNSKVSCEIVIQYACEDTLDPQVDNFWPWVKGSKTNSDSKFFGEQYFRAKDYTGDNIAAPRDGVPRDSNDAATDTIPDNEDSAIPSTVETRRYGMQENFFYYQLCQFTERNKGLYTADQRINRRDQRGTRQNPNGNRRGLECPEERDYYPWWAPSPWIDIAVLSDSAGQEVCYPDNVADCTQRCQFYMNNTMNFNPKGYCDVNHTAPIDGGINIDLKKSTAAWRNRNWYNNRGACEANGFVWYEVSHSDNLQFEPNNFVCAHTQFARANQLGNARADTVISQNQNMSAGIVKDAVNEGVNANRFLWTVPKIPTAHDEQAYFKRGMEAAYQSCVIRMRYNISSADFQQWPIDAVDAGSERMVDHLNNSRFADDDRTPLEQDPYVYIGPGTTENDNDMFVKLKVNTNQYGRTFQDRSYVFSIKPLPTESVAASNAADSPEIDYDSLQTALNNGGKIYNVNVRGKRGNIVQTYPAVEYDFIPNAVALSTNDVLHFQWTGSDYNPRRGCNDAAGGPPDANTFSTDANAHQNPRADRSNVIFMYHMGNNVPMDYLGYDVSNDSLSYNDRLAAAKETVLQNVPCYDPDTDDDATATACYESIMRLAYLNQQRDTGSLVLRAGRNCLTPAELDEFRNQDVADFHPLNCAKMNAKPYPYFDGGLVFMRRNGWFPYYSSRNNNFSNRDQIGIICVGPDCKVDNSTMVLQDKNPQFNGLGLDPKSIRKPTRQVASTCYDTASGAGGANANEAHTCLPPQSEGIFNDSIDANVLSSETFATQEGDNDGLGDGNEQGCATLEYSRSNGDDSVETDVVLAVVLLIVGLFTAWLAYYLYNRYQARREGESKFRYETAWQSGGNIDKKGSKKMPIGGAAAAAGVASGGKRASTPQKRPASLRFTEANPALGSTKKISRDSTRIKKQNSSRSPSPARPVPPPRPAKKSSDRLEMI